MKRQQVAREGLGKQLAFVSTGQLAPKTCLSHRFREISPALRTAGTPTEGAGRSVLGRPVASFCILNEGSYSRSLVGGKALCKEEAAPGNEVERDTSATTCKPIWCFSLHFKRNPTLPSYQQADDGVL